MRAPALLRRQPIRIRLTLAYGGVVVLVLAGLGIFVYFSFQSGLDADINGAVRSRANDLQALIAQGGTPATPSGREDGDSGLRQVLRTDGTVLATSPGLTRPLLRPAELREVQRHPILRDRREQFRLYARRLRPGSSSILVVGTSLDQREHAIERLGGVLLAGGTLAVLTATLIGYGLSAGALRPVEAMRSRAASISTIEPRARLPLPEARDEIHALGSTINEMLARLERAAQHERDFIADASHELRTPLAILKTEIEVALRGERTIPELRDALRVAGWETNRLAHLAQELLVLERADRGKLELRREDVNVADLLEQIGARAEPPSAIGNAAPDIQAPDDLVVNGDRDTLGRAIGNLIDNARRHGGEPVTVMARKSDAGIEIHVLDEGPGFRPGFAERAFDRFARSDPKRTTTGAGLGLAIVRSIAQAHGGDAFAANRADRPGADVWIVVPAAQRSPSPRRGAQHSAAL